MPFLGLKKEKRERVKGERERKKGERERKFLLDNVDSSCHHILHFTMIRYSSINIDETDKSDSESKNYHKGKSKNEMTCSPCSLLIMIFTKVICVRLFCIPFSPIFTQLDTRTMSK